MKRSLAIAFVLAGSASARADDPPPSEGSAAPVPNDQKDQPPPTPDAKAEANDAATRALEERVKKLEDALDQATDDNKYLEDKLSNLVTVKLSGYVDLGAFVTSGNGAGTRTDLGHVYLPQFSNVPDSWVFMGDPLSTMVNSRGDVADTGESRAITFDPINSHGKSTFLVNAVNLGLVAGIGETGTVQTSIDFLPRSRDISDPTGLFQGDYLDVKLAYAEWRPKIDAFALALQAGKFDSVVGYEYRSLESPDRLTVTPSLVCRYVCGRPIGLKARAKFFDDALIANVAVTNGSHFTETFDFSDETDQNQFKTVAGRLSYQLAHALELGVSGAFGAQDWQPDDSVHQWHVGGDVHLDYKDVELTAELVHGRARGATSAVGPHCDIAPCLRYTAAYGLAGYRLTNVFEPYVRVDWRDALHESGASFVYYSELMRVTVGLRAEIGPHVIAKIEATAIRELDEIPDFPDDVITSSLVIKY